VQVQRRAQVVGVVVGERQQVEAHLLEHVQHERLGDHAVVRLLGGVFGVRAAHGAFQVGEAHVGALEPLDEGEYDYAAFFGALNAIPYDGLITIYADGKGGDGVFTPKFVDKAPRSLAFVRQLAGAKRP
jgi:hypothetical protein